MASYNLQLIRTIINQRIKHLSDKNAFLRNDCNSDRNLMGKEQIEKKIVINYNFSESET